MILEGTGADLVLIEAAAMLPGEPWAYATDPAAADRGRRLARLIVLARSLGKPVIFIRNVPPSLMPGLGWLAASCDAVIDGGLGVQLARFNPIGVTVARATTPVYAGARDPREAPAVRALLDTLTGGPNPAVQLAGDAARSWRSLPALYRDHAVFVTASADQAREQAASGARVIGPLSSGTDAGTVRGQLESVRGARPAGITDVRSWLREIFVATRPPPGWPTRAHRRTARRPRAGTADRRARPGRRRRRGRPLASALLDQRLQPTEVIAAVPTGGAAAPAVREALGKLTDHDIRVVVTSAAGPADPAQATADGGRGLHWARPLARLADAPWLTPWAAGDAARPATYLLDLACARECAQADAVGFGSGEYEFTHWLEKPALVRAALLAPGGPAAADWGSHGLRLFTIIA